MQMHRISYLPIPEISLPEIPPAVGNAESLHSFLPHYSWLSTTSFVFFSAGRKDPPNPPLFLLLYTLIPPYSFSSFGHKPLFFLLVKTWARLVSSFFKWYRSLDLRSSYLLILYYNHYHQFYKCSLPLFLC